MSDIPSDLHYTAEHEMIRPQWRRHSSAGITDYAQSAL